MPPGDRTKAQTEFAFPTRHAAGSLQLSWKHIKPILRSTQLGYLRRVASMPRPTGPWEVLVSEEELKKRLEMLRIEHRDLDAAIDALSSAGSTDQLQVARLKKRKLRLKDQIAMLEDYLIPDIIA